jgi:hypothetical protein
MSLGNWCRHQIMGLRAHLEHWKTGRFKSSEHRPGGKIDLTDKETEEMHSRIAELEYLLRSKSSCETTGKQDFRKIIRR